MKWLKMIPNIFICVVFTLLVGEVNCMGYNEIFDKANAKIKRHELPVEVSDEVWSIFKKIQKIHPIIIKKDPTYRKNTVSKNVKAQLGVIPSKFEINITIFDENIEEDILAHEALHAFFIVQGFPFFYRKSFPEKKTMANLDNGIQHFYIFSILEKMGFTPYLSAKQTWETGVDIMNINIDRIPSDAPEYAINTIGASYTLSGLISGLSIEEIKKYIHPIFNSSISIGVLLFEELKKYDLSKKDECFNVRLKIANILGLTDKDVVIGVLDFKNYWRSYYSIETGKRLVVKK